MRTFDCGCFFNVAVSEREVHDFARRWPCFGAIRPICFQFDKRNGDLVDIMPYDADADMDGAGVAALADDAKHYGTERLKQRKAAP